ncbi:hypothetical protein GCM10023153_08390 [Ornithinibacter aureus]|uniref:Uncharacterized protein n=1 Tax=Ornithinibacter aureus TaxID=622664 RepID=A0ABP8JHH2_9MICO|nr:hypothetical protein [Ornithinibacter aureus]KAF0834708.1 hypothetical protein C8E84_2545 [Ornithinibacter aureus]
MAKRPEDHTDQPENTGQSELPDRTELIPQASDDTERFESVDTTRMPSAAEVPAAPPAVHTPAWAAAVTPAAAAAAPAKTKGKGAWWTGRLALAGGALAAGLLLGGVVGATAATVAGHDDRGSQISEGGGAGFEGRGEGRGGLGHGPRGMQGDVPDGSEGQGQLPGGGQGQDEGQLPGGGTSTDPGDANGTSQTT